MAARYGTIVPLEVTVAPQVASTVPAVDRPEDAVEPDSRASLREWDDPDHPEIDYTMGIFSAMAGQGYQIRGWWGFEETRAEIDESPLVFARNVSAVPDTGFMPTTPGLFCRCREGESLVIYNADTYIRGNFRSDTLPTSIRIDDRPAETQQWSKLTTSKGSGLFGVRAEAMMRRFLGAEKVFFRIEYGGQRYDASFDLAGIQPVVEKVAGALEQDDVLRPRTRLTGARLRWLEEDGQALVDELNALADTDPGDRQMGNDPDGAGQQRSYGGADHCCHPGAKDPRLCFGRQQVLSWLHGLPERVRSDPIAAVVVPTRARVRRQTEAPRDALKGKT